MKSKIKSVSWGHEKIDSLSQGIPADDFAVLESADHRAGNVLLAYYLLDGLRNGELCTLVSHCTFEQFNCAIEFFGHDLLPYFQSGQLIHLTYHPEIKLILGMSPNYQNAFEEIFRLSGQAPTRIAFAQVDAIINLSNILVTNISVQKISAVSRSPLTASSSILASFVGFQDETHQALSIALQKLSSGYYKVGFTEDADGEFCFFKIVKQPWYNYSTKDEYINLKESRFVAKLKHAK